MTRAAEFKPGISGSALARIAEAAETVELRQKDSGRLAEDGSEDYQLELLDFDGGVEIRVPGHDKGQAVETILNETEGWRAWRISVMIRLTKMHFRSIKGKGLAVLVRERVRETAADVWLKPPEELIEFLENWLLASGGDTTDERDTTDQRIEPVADRHRKDGEI